MILSRSHLFSISGVTPSSPQLFPSVNDFFALAYSSRSNGPSFMPRSVKMGGGGYDCPCCLSLGDFQADP